MKMPPELPVRGIDICLCTFRRRQVVDTLRSLANLKLEPGWAVRVIVADNDDAPSARELVEEAAQKYRLKVTYLHAPARNISIARNACLSAATAPLLAFVDDDETVSPRWLKALIQKMDDSGADVVIGPVRSVYPDDCPDWMREGDFHSTRPTWPHGELRTAYTGNMLMKRKPELEGIRFSKRLGRSGGEDTVFFAEVYKSAGRFAYTPEAIASEIVLPERLSFAWLFRRYFRSGQTQAHILLNTEAVNFATRLKHMALATCKALFCYGAAMVNGLSASRMRYWLLRGAMHTGVVLRLMGQRELVQYGEDA